jgi:hypothetical protein
VDPRAGLDAIAKKLCPCQKSNPGPAHKLVCLNASIYSKKFSSLIWHQDLKAAMTIYTDHSQLNVMTQSVRYLGRMPLGQAAEGCPVAGNTTKNLRVP